MEALTALVMVLRPGRDAIAKLRGHADISSLERAFCFFYRSMCGFVAGICAAVVLTLMMLPSCLVGVALYVVDGVVVIAITASRLLRVLVVALAADPAFGLSAEPLPPAASRYRVAPHDVDGGLHSESRRLSGYSTPPEDRRRSVPSPGEGWRSPPPPLLPVQQSNASTLISPESALELLSCAWCASFQLLRSAQRCRGVEGCGLLCWVAAGTTTSTESACRWTCGLWSSRRSAVSASSASSAAVSCNAPRSSPLPLF